MSEIVALHPRSVSIAFRENSRNPGHVRVSVFIGRNKGARGNSGEIVVRTDEWDELRHQITHEGVDVSILVNRGFLSDDEVLDEWDDLEMMKRMHMWPLGDRLPVKRREGPEPRMGIVYAGTGARVMLHGRRPGELGLDVTEYLDYRSFEAMVEDGWVVD